MKHGLSFSLRDELAASAVTPIAAWKQVDQLLRMWSSFAALDRGAGALHDVGTCIEAVNLMASLHDMNLVTDPDALLSAAGVEFQGVIQAGAPYLMPSGSAFECILRDYGPILASLPARIVIRCIRRTELGMRQAHNGQLKRGATVIEVRA